MTKKELMKKLNDLLSNKGMQKIETFSGSIGWNDNKATLEDAIKCLEASDEEMNDYLTVVKIAYPNIYKKIIEAGNYLTHSHNRYYIYTAAKALVTE